jgi:hypothetical protein
MWLAAKRIKTMKSLFSGAGAEFRLRNFRE